MTFWNSWQGDHQRLGDKRVPLDHMVVGSFIYTGGSGTISIN